MQKSSAQEVSSCSSCRRAQHKRAAHEAHAGELSSCRRAQHKRSAHEAYAGELMQLNTRGQLMQLIQKRSCSSGQKVSSCRRAHAAQHKRSAHASHAEDLMQLSTRGQFG